MKQKKFEIFKIALAVIFLIVMVVLVIKILPYFSQITTEEGRQILKDQISGLGIYGGLVIIGLTIAQIFFAVLPGEPVEVLAGMCFGPIGGLIVLYIGIFLSTSLIMFLVRVLGRDFLYTFVKKEKIEKMENSKIFKSNKIIPILMILFALPGTPKDLLVYIGSFLPISTMRFLLIATLFRFPSLITSTIVGNSLLDGNWGFIIGVYGVTLVISVICIYFYNRHVKKEEANDKKEADKIQAK